MASFLDKICSKRQRKSENKNYCSVSFHPEGSEKIPKKKAKIFKKLKKYYCGFISSQNRLEKAVKERK